ncbi:MAG: hypothetical protein ACRECW_11255 [Phyllobacterium sp.]
MSGITLKNGLLINAILTGATGLLMALFANPVASLLVPGAPAWLIFAIGAAFVLFAIDVALIARWKSGSAALVGFVFLADLAFIIAVPAILLMMPHAFTALGIAASLGVSAIVACFAWIEWQGLQAMSAANAA